MRDHAFKLLGLAAAVMLTVGTIFYHFEEGWSWVDAFYFSAIAVTTVGFGDFVPTTDASKLFTVGYIFVGVAIITSYLNERLRRLPMRHRLRRESEPSEIDD